MLYIDQKYIGTLSTRLKNFKQKNSFLWNISCPFCGDISKGKQKARGYFYRIQQGMAYKCHHCGESMGLGNFLKRQFPEVFKEYILEMYRETKPLTETVRTVQKKVVELKDSVLDDLKCCADLSSNHPVAKYLDKRRIPKDKQALLYYTLRFKEYTNSVVPEKFKDTKDDHPRLIIPYFTNAGKVFAYSARAFGNEEPKYYTIKIDDSHEKVYGLERLNSKKRVYCVEGPLDSLFLPNAIAVSGATYDTPTLHALKSNLTIVPDNEPRSKEITKIILKTIDLGFSVCMLPHGIKQKDINEMVLAGKEPKEIVEMIDANTYSGLNARLRFAEWNLTSQNK